MPHVETTTNLSDRIYKNRNEEIKIKSVWKNRNKPFLIADLALSTAVLTLCVIGFVHRYSHSSSLLVNLALLLLGVVLILRGIESFLTPKKKSLFILNLGAGLFVLILAIIILIPKISGS